MPILRNNPEKRERRGGKNGCSWQWLCPHVGVQDGSKRAAVGVVRDESGEEGRVGS